MYAESLRRKAWFSARSGGLPPRYPVGTVRNHSTINGSEARKDIGAWIDYYNQSRGIAVLLTIPDEMYKGVPSEAASDPRLEEIKAAWQTRGFILLLLPNCPSFGDQPYDVCH